MPEKSERSLEKFGHLEEPGIVDIFLLKEGE